MTENDSVIYAFAHVETWLEEFAKTKHLNPADLIQRVTGLLSHDSQPAVELKPKRRSSWSSMTKQERSIEMRRRMAVARANGNRGPGRKKHVIPAKHRGGVA